MNEPRTVKKWSDKPLSLEEMAAAARGQVGCSRCGCKMIEKSAKSPTGKVCHHCGRPR